MSTCRNEVILNFTSIIKKKRQAQLPWQWYHHEFKNHLMLTAKNVLKMLKNKSKMFIKLPSHRSSLEIALTAGIMVLLNDSPNCV